MGKNQQKKQRIGRSRAPLPTGKTDNEWYKIIIQDSDSSQRLKEIQLTPQAANLLLNAKPSDIPINGSAIVSIQDLVKNRMFDATQIDALKHASSYQLNVYGWT